MVVEGQLQCPGAAKCLVVLVYGLGVVKGAGTEFGRGTFVAKQARVQGADAHFRAAAGDTRGVVDGNPQTQFRQLSGNTGSGNAGTENIDSTGWCQGQVVGLVFANAFTQQAGAFERALIHLGHGKAPFSKVAADLARRGKRGHCGAATTQARNAAQHTGLPHKRVLGGRKTVQKPSVHWLLLKVGQIAEPVFDITVEHAELDTPLMHGSPMPSGEQGQGRFGQGLSRDRVRAQGCHLAPVLGRQRVGLNTDEMQDLVGFADDFVGADAKVQTTTKAELGDGKPRALCGGCSLNHLAGLQEYALHLLLAVGAEIDVVKLCGNRLRALPVQLGRCDVLAVWRHAGRFTYRWSSLGRQVGCCR